uniref:Protein phosphatase 1 regulatory subunit n=1 Tax=Gadus morhua TaxID=8049 RepID=A0A8C5BLI8_GADMO
MKMADAKQKRNEQLKRWLGSETDLEPPVIKKKKTRVKFDDGAVFLAACSSGDAEEVLRMLERGADINYANVDGLTALHQACIDDNVDMVTFLVEHNASINQPDNEGWIPLHAAASCGYMDIAEYLISKGADVGVVNSEGETPLDIAEEEAMEELLQNEINRQGVDIEAARKEEERIMLRDARQWLNSGQIQDVRHTKSGGTALHVAAAKGYVEVLKLLIQAGYDVNIKDYDGWTSLHAAAHWGKQEACRILVENHCDMDLINKVGQTAFDVSDEDVLGYLEELHKKQDLLSNDKKDVKKSPLIETTTTGDNNQSLKPPKSEKTVLLEPEKIVAHIEVLEQEKVDEEEEGKKDESSCSSEEEEEEDSESENEAEKTKTPGPPVSLATTAAVTTPPAAVTVATPSSPTNQVTTPTSPVKKVSSPRATEEDRKDESPASWRLGLRKTGSYGALAEITATKESQKEKDAAGVMRSASSPRLSSSVSMDNKDKEKDKSTRLAYVAPTIPRRLASTSDIDEKENRDSASLARSSSYTRRRWDDDLKNSDSTASTTTASTTTTTTNRVPIYQRSTSHTLALGRSGSTRDVPSKSWSTSSLEPNASNTKPWQSPSSHYQSYSIYRSGSFGRRGQHEDLTSTTTSTSPTTTTTSSPPFCSASVLAHVGKRFLVARYWSEESSDRDKEKESAAVIPTMNTGSTTTTSSTTSTIIGSDGRERRRSYLTPVRDEESESQRKARSRQARQSRRSTQGVTLTDLQEAEKIGKGRTPRSREEEREKQDKEKLQEERKETETREDDYRSRYRSLDEVRGPARGLGGGGGCSAEWRQRKETDKEEEKEGEDKSQPRSIRDRRRPREKRRSTGVSFWTHEVGHAPGGGTILSSINNTTSYERNESVGGRTYGDGRRPYSSRLDRDDNTDYKKLYEQILAENEKLKAQLRDTDLELADLKLQLEKATCVYVRLSDALLPRPQERRALERKISEMEEELKTLPDLKADNQRLKDENGALIRVISKLSK